MVHWFFLACPLVQADDVPAAKTATTQSDAADDAADPTDTTPDSLRTRFERSVAARAIDTHRLGSMLLVLQPKSRTSYDMATSAYKTFADLHARGELARAWPVLAEVVWSLEAVERSDDWELRDTVVRARMLPAARDLQVGLVNRFAAEAWRERFR